MTVETKEDSIMNIQLQHLMVDVPKGITAEYVKEMVVSIMYNQNKLDFREAREILGVSRREFEETILPRYGVTVLGDDIDLEINEILNDE